MSDPLTSSDIQRIIDNVNALNLWAEGNSAYVATLANGRTVPSPSKMIADAKLFKAPTAYSSGTTYNDATQPVIQGGVVYAPQPASLPIGPEVFNSANWYVLQGWIEGTTLDQLGADITNVGDFDSDTIDVDTLTVNANATIGGTLGVTGVGSFTDDILVGGAAGTSISSMTGVGIAVYGSNGSGIGFESGTTPHEYRAWLNGSGDFQISNIYNGGAAPFRIFPSGNTLLTYAADITPNATANREQFSIGGNGYSSYISMDAVAMYLGHHSAARNLCLQTNEITRMTFNASGNIFFGDFATNPSSSQAGLGLVPNGGTHLISTASNTTANVNLAWFTNPNGLGGSIALSGTTTSYNTTSDPRLKSKFEKISTQRAFSMIKQAVDEDIVGEFYWKSDKKKEKVWGYNAFKMFDLQKGFGASEGFGPRDAEIGEVYKDAELKQKVDENGKPMFQDVFETRTRQKMVQVAEMEKYREDGIEKLRPKTKIVKKNKDLIEIIDGSAVLKKGVEVEIEEKVINEVGLVDEKGTPVMEEYQFKIGSEPIMIEVEAEKKVSPFGVDQSKRVPLHEIAIDGLIREIENQDQIIKDLIDRIEILERN